jgi:hypothetical protein
MLKNKNKNKTVRRITCAASYSGERVRYGLSQSAQIPNLCVGIQNSNVVDKKEQVFKSIRYLAG